MQNEQILIVEDEPAIREMIVMTLEMAGFDCLQAVDIQQLINHDMKSNWSAYPKIWGLKTTDKNIDHRRVPNLEAFFERHGQSLSKTDVDSFQAGDIVSWRLPNGNLPHIGIVSAKNSFTGTPLIIHNIGRGTQEENILFKYPITAHFRY